MTSLPRREAVIQKPLHPYLVALVLFLFALGIRLAIKVGPGMSFVTFYPAIVITALLYGFRPALMVVVLSVIASQYFFSDPMMSFQMQAEDLPALAIFGIAGTAMAFVIDRLARNMREIDETNAELQKVTHRLQQDILQRMQVEAALRESELRFRTLFDLSSVGAMQCDAEDGRFIQVNRKYCEITGYSEAELRNMTRRDVTHPDDRAMQESRSTKLLSGEISEYTTQKRLVRKDGSTRWVDITCTA
ncbi:MAG TPA: PAS domain S-box protein, partial [Methylophilaceae bacterium]|nr:PAS domain S-box protein [Methylophilaceae bacterium]